MQFRMPRLSFVAIAFGLFATLAFAHPSVRVPRQAEEDDGSYRGDVADEPLGLPSNSTSIRANIVDTFSCEGKKYGYYADIDNECQVFHVCLPVTFSDGVEKMYKWSFICPEETIFDQEHFVCSRAEDSVPCNDAATFYSLNDNFGKIPEEKEV